MNCPFLISWKLEGKDKNGRIIHYKEKLNLQVNSGKQEILNFIGNLATPSPSGFIFLGFGASSFTPDVTDTKLGGATGHEYIGNAGRYIITNYAQATETYVYSGLTFTEKLTGSITIDGSTDANATDIGSPVQSYALFNTVTLPSTVDGTSGTMFNELVDDTQFLLKNGVNVNSISVTIVLRQ